MSEIWHGLNKEFCFKRKEKLTSFMCKRRAAALRFVLIFLRTATASNYCFPAPEKSEITQCFKYAEKKNL